MVGNYPLHPILDFCLFWTKSSLFEAQETTYKISKRLLDLALTDLPALQETDHT